MALCSISPSPVRAVLEIQVQEGSHVSFPWATEIKAGTVNPEAPTRYRPYNYEIQTPWLPTDCFKVVRKKDRFLCTWWELLKTYHNPKNTRRIKNPSQEEWMYIHSPLCYFSVCQKTHPICPQASCREEPAFPKYLHSVLRLLKLQSQKDARNPVSTTWTSTGTPGDNIPPHKEEELYDRRPCFKLKITSREYPTS